MLKPITIMYPVIPAKDEEERARLRPIGRNTERYQAAIRGLCDIIRQLDEMDIWGAAAIEHHFWSEGYEPGPSPGAMNAYWAAITKKLRVGQLGYVMSTHNPIRVAEEVAVIDHLSQGRCFVGFARGYQSRWTNVLGQHFGTRATKSPTSIVYNADLSASGEAQDRQDDLENRAIFEENVEIALKAWTEESFSHNGRTWQIPYPHDTGVVDWPLARAGVTQRLGAPGEVDADGHTRRVSVVPALFTKPHPPIFCAGSGSQDTVDFCARKGFIPTYFAGMQVAGPMSQRYQRLAGEHGRTLAPGRNQCLVRWLQIGKSDDDALNRIRDYDLDIWKNFYASMGRRRVENDDYFGSLVRSGLFVFGDVDSVRRQMLEQWQQFPAEYVAIVNHYAQMPADLVLETLDTFTRKVKPDLDELVDKAGR
jgi:alkanesulfonate monooxygenase SsuD/methylene tetrahydromethanopterin reductase-like flavin-dependent oxidoreductase (luciferase family)